MVDYKSLNDRLNYTADYDNPRGMIGQPEIIVVDGKRFVRSEGGGAGFIPLLVIPAAGFAFLCKWIDENIGLLKSAITHPLDYPILASMMAVTACIAAYLVWRFVRMAYLMTLSLIEPSLHSYRCVADYVHQFICRFRR